MNLKRRWSIAQALAALDRRWNCCQGLVLVSVAVVAVAVVAATSETGFFVIMLAAAALAAALGGWALARHRRYRYRRRARTSAKEAIPKEKRTRRGERRPPCLAGKTTTTSHFPVATASIKRSFGYGSHAQRARASCDDGLRPRGRGARSRKVSLGVHDTAPGAAVRIRDGMAESGGAARPQGEDYLRGRGKKRFSLVCQTPSAARLRRKGVRVFAEHALRETLSRRMPLEAEENN